MPTSAVRRSMRRVLLAVAGSGALVLAGCGDAFGPTSRLLEGHQRWLHTRPASYAFQLGVSCFCALPPQPVRIEVRGDSVVSAVDASGTPIAPAVARRYATIDTLFDVIGRAIDAHAERLDVRYDRARGYPTSIAIDYWINAADDEISYTVTGFVAH